MKELKRRQQNTRAKTQEGEQIVLRNATLLWEPMRYCCRQQALQGKTGHEESQSAGSEMLASLEG